MNFKTNYIYHKIKGLESEILCEYLTLFNTQHRVLFYRQYFLIVFFFFGGKRKKLKWMYDFYL